ncbi:hypothetical protein RclHR1_05960010 [Rhizophagus clarus]|uniref:Uncharacterized protein n=1 Tax=Rhizophagus clarus TaxID=94130 RepID=A0A2Z6S847_9GLOM|nr:hypothetical protein RclHR1_05960010 [Rhizophagus clarus]
MFWTYDHKRTLANASFQRSETSIRSGLKLELHFEADQVISKVWNSNSKWTKVFESLKLHSKANYCLKLHFEAVWNSTSRWITKSGTSLRSELLSGTPFRGRPIQNSTSKQTTVWKSFIGGLLSRRSGPSLELKADRRFASFQRSSRRIRSHRLSRRLPDKFRRLKF